jgi:CRP-like cAMP-binding protein
MACSPDVLKQGPLFALLDDEELAVLATQVAVKTYAARQRVYKAGDPGGRAYVLVSGSVRVTTVDEDQQDVVMHEPAVGEFFGFASMIERTPHQTIAMALIDSTCLEVDRRDITVQVQQKPDAGMDMLTVLSRQLHVDARATSRLTASLL